jgi:hypothetical protein
MIGRVVSMSMIGRFRFGLASRASQPCLPSMLATNSGSSGLLFSQTNVYAETPDITIVLT